MFEGIVANHARAIIQFGLLLLIATPIARVLFAAIAFAWKGLHVRGDYVNRARNSALQLVGLGS